jgi:hypothetical protein
MPDDLDDILDEFKAAKEKGKERQKQADEARKAVDRKLTDIRDRLLAPPLELISQKLKDRGFTSSVDQHGRTGTAALNLSREESGVGRLAFSPDESGGAHVWAAASAQEERNGSDLDRRTGQRYIPQDELTQAVVEATTVQWIRVVLEGWREL